MNLQFLILPKLPERTSQKLNRQQSKIGKSLMEDQSSNIYTTNRSIVTVKVI